MDGDTRSRIREWTEVQVFMYSAFMESGMDMGFLQCRAVMGKAGGNSPHRLSVMQVPFRDCVLYCVLVLISVLTRRNSRVYISTAIAPAYLISKHLNKRMETYE